MRELRSASQILFGFLPEQTVDLAGRVWKVKEWRNPLVQQVDQVTLRREVINAAKVWESRGKDSGYVKYLREGRELEVRTLDKDNGVQVEEFPNVWKCKKCSRVYFSTAPASCRCKSQSFGQLPFVSFHECGLLRQPWVARCQAHDDLAVRLPGTASAKEITFYCPEPGCKTPPKSGFGYSKCDCGEGLWTHNVHRAASVYTAQSIVIVNPPSQERVKRLEGAGGESSALSWSLDSFRARHPEDGRVPLDVFVRDLVAKGIPQSLAADMGKQAAAAGALQSEPAQLSLSEEQRTGASAEAVTIALATDQTREKASQLGDAERTPAGPLRDLFASTYPRAMSRARLEDVELIEKFPVLTGQFGYTRGGSTSEQTRLRPFERQRRFVVYADVAETEALFVRLDPWSVHGWLAARGQLLDAAHDARTARLSVLSAITVPGRGDDASKPTAGRDVLTLVHSYAHRLIRRVSVFAGIDRNALSELVVPYQMGFFVYAAARGDFVLGGLQAVFEGELHHVLDDLVTADHRCPLDPGCMRAGAACVACLHLGEPSCRYFNRFLDRRTLFGRDGYLRSRSPA